MRTIVMLQSILLLALACGCSEKRQETAAVYRVQSVAIAPVLNMSGSDAIDTLHITDILFSELQQDEHISVVPVNRVLQVLARNNRRQVDSPQEAISLAEQLQVDGVLVVAVTEYQPYYPPLIGIAAQLYSPRPQRYGSLDVSLTTRQARPFAVSMYGDRSLWPVAHFQKVYNASRQDVRQAVKEYAELRNADESPYGWEQYIRSQEQYVRFVARQALLSTLSDPGQASPGGQRYTSAVQE